MKTKNLIAAIIAAGTLGSLSSLKAQQNPATYTPQPNDVWLAVTGVGQGGLVDIGPGGTSAQVQSTLNGFSMNSLIPDLNQLLPGWNATTTFAYSIYSIGTAGYFISGDVNNGTPSYLNRGVTPDFQAGVNNLSTMYYNNGIIPSVAGNYLVINQTGDSSVFFPSSYIAPNLSFNTFNGNITTTNNGSLALFYVPNTGAASQVATVQAVPEPSTYALLGLGALLFIIVYRRRNTAKVS